MFRRLPDFLERQRAGTWLADDEREAVRADELNGSRVLVVGFGSIGRAVAARLRPFGADVVGVARRATPVDGVRGLDALPELLPSADVVVDLLPLTPDTRGLINADAISGMKPGALFVNAGRGGTVDADALLAALRAGRIRAALDVTDPEPLPDGHPLWSAPNVLITPHVAGDVRGERRRAWALVAEQVARLERGEPLRNVVEAGY
jgi:phosphoglycerate dehydrogenase-like enzyme